MNFPDEFDEDSLPRTHDLFGQPLTEAQLRMEALTREEIHLVDFLDQDGDPEGDKEALRLVEVRAAIRKLRGDE